MADPKTAPPRPTSAIRAASRRSLRLVEAAIEPTPVRKRRTDSSERAARRRLILDTLAAIARSGQAVTAARICVGGDVLLLTGNHRPPPDEPSEDVDWVTLAGET